MTDNPFNSDRFVRIWLKHFKNSIPPIKFEFINGVQFYKNKYVPLFVNIGKNLTKGVYYSIDATKIRKTHNAYLIRDIPTYFNLPSIKEKGLRLKKIRQYNGYLTELNKYKDLDDFLSQKYNSSGRNSIRRRFKGLDASFDIEYVTYFGAIEQETYDLVINKLHELLIKRFAEKKTEYHILEKWEYFKELHLSMILNKEAVLLVVYENKTPIGIYLALQFNQIISGAIPVFDTDYAKFGLGNILTLKLIEWSLDNNMKIFDSSKGDYGEKEKISDLKYSFEYHVLFNPGSLISRGIAFGVSAFYGTIHYLREKKFHSLYHNLVFKLKSKKEIEESDHLDYKLVDKDFELPEEKDLIYIDIKETAGSSLKKVICNFLYKSRAHIDTLKVAKSTNHNTYYLIAGNTKLQVIYLK